MSKISDERSKRGISRSEDSMRDKLRLKIRQRIHNLPSEGGDENMNTLNQTESVRTRRNHGGKVSSRDEEQIEKDLHANDSKSKRVKKEYDGYRKTREHSQHLGEARGREVLERNRRNTLTDRRRETDGTQPREEYSRGRPLVEYPRGRPSEEYPMGKLNHRDEVFPKHKSKREYEGSIRKHLKDEPRPMDKSYLGEKANRRDMSNPVDRRAPHESRNKEKSDTRHDTQRDENHGKGIGGVRSKNKLPLAPKQLRLEQPLKKVEKRSLTSQKQAASSGKSEFLSSLVKLKDALQSHSKDQKSTKEPLMSKSGADLNIQPCKDDATKKKGSPSAKPLPLKTDEVKEDATMWRITTTRKLAEFEHKMASVRDDLDINPMMDNPVFSTGSSVNLFCPLCHEMFVNPRLLPCLHTFCKRCLENLVVPRSSSLSCPACRTDVPLTERGVGAFPPNFVVTTMMDVAAVRAHDKNPIMCSSCEDKLPAAARCIECMDFLCHDCRNAHMRLRLTKTHRVVSLDELKSSPHPEDLLHRPIFCMEHAHEKLRYYCESCEQAICRECTMTSHSTERHKYTQLTDTIDKQTQNISQLVEKLKRKVPIVTQSTKDVEEVTCRLEARAEVAKSEIQKCFPRILKALQDREKGMMAEVETMVQRKSKVLGIQQERLENELKRLTTTCNFTEEVLRHGNSVEILVIKKQLCDRLNDLISTKFQGEPEENDVIYFVANQDEVLKALENLGQIKTSNAFPTNCTVADDMKNATKGRKSKFTVLTRDHSGAQCTGGGEDVMVDVYTSDGRTVPAEVRPLGSSPGSSHALSRYNSQNVEDHRNGSYGVSYSPFNVGMHKVSVTVRDKHIQGSPFKVNVVNTGESYLKFGKKGTEIGEFNGIFGVAVDDEGHIIITDCHNHRVQVFNQNGGFMFQFGRKGEGSGQFQCPTGVGVDPDGRIVVCERLGSRIQIFDRDGMFLHKFSVPDLKASTLAVDANRRIIVADSANRCIHVISLDTGQSFKFGSFGDGNGELNYPCYVAVNSQGHIIVSDMHSHRIQVFDPRGRFMFNFGRKGSQDGELMRPTGVAVGHDGNIIVADRDNHRIQVFSSEGRFVTKFGTKGDGDGQLNDPHGLALTPEGNIIVADFRNNRVQLFGQPA